jgi:multidrug resistance efflux pump
MLLRAIVIVVVVAALAAALFFSQVRHEPLKVSGFIEADEIRVGSRVGGRVLRVPAVEGQVVNPGDLLVELEPYDLLERRAEAAAALAAKQAQYEQLKAGYRAEEIAQANAARDALAATLEKLRAGPRPQEIAAAAALLDQAKAQQELAQITFDRIKPAFERNAASNAEMDTATQNVAATKAAVVAREQELNQLKEGSRKEDIAEAQAKLAQADANLAQMQKGYRKEEIEAAKANVDAADAALKVIDRELAELKIAAPVKGVVEAVDLQPGDLVAPNAPVLSLMDTSHLWVRAYVPENRMNIQLDRKFRITVDSFPDKTFHGHASFIARQAEFTPGNVQTPEERSKQVFRMKVTLDDGLDVLRAGMSADVWLEEEK